MEFDPYAYETHEDPYPIYAWLREEAPAYWNDRLKFWALSRYEDVLGGFREPQTYSNAQGVALERSTMEDPSLVASFLAMDPPRHDQMRALVSKGFTPRRVAELEPRVRELARHYLAQLVERRQGDFIQDFAGKLPMDVVSEMLGVPQEDRDTLRHWADAVLHREEGQAQAPEAARQASQNLLTYFAKLVAERRRKPGHDLASALLKAEIDGARLTDREIMAFLFLMIIAGNETTTKLLGNAVYWLWRNPSERNKIRRDPALIPAWVEETLRYDASTQMLARTLLRDVEIHGEKMKAGDRVLLLIGSANRDPRVFTDPDSYQIERDNAQSLAFGKGTHFCLGASLARLEARVALEEFHARMPNYDIDATRLVRVHSPNVRGFASLPIEF